jgi:hypothetical protein
VKIDYMEGKKNALLYIKYKYTCSMQIDIIAKVLKTHGWGVACSYNPSTQETKAGRSRVEGQKINIYTKTSTIIHKLICRACL